MKQLSDYLYHETERGTLYCGDCLEIMPLLADKSVDLVLTSPPYDNLRDYDGYSFDFENTAKQIYRILKDGGVCVWVVGDATINGSETGTSFRQALYFKEIGFNLHDTMIYEKANFSNPSFNRYHQIFEYMFVLVKRSIDTFNPIIDRVNIYGSSWGKNTVRNRDGTMSERKKNIAKELGMRFNIWRFNTVGQENPCRAQEHPAMFPEQLAIDHVISWSNENDTVLDCFMGSGTTAKACIRMNRRYIGIDVSEKYCEIAKRRIETALDQTEIEL